MIARLVMAAALGVSAAQIHATPALADPSAGLYEITARIELPNVPPVAAPIRATRCLTAAALKSGAAFGIQSRNPLRVCTRSDVKVSRGAATFHITCPGPNAPSAQARFEVTPNGFKGIIRMNMGGKNMTMTERQTARRIGDCP
ncbi:MAG: DUF3617 domain-containing protein [Methyloligellaceae bacterium]